MTWLQALVTVGTPILTAIAGVGVFVLGQYVQRFILEPIQEQRRIKGEVAYNLTFLGNISNYSTMRRQADQMGVSLVDVTTPDEAAKTLRGLASRLRSSLETIPFYGTLERWKWVIPYEAGLKAIDGLTGWCNSVHSSDTHPHMRRVAHALDIRDDRFPKASDPA